MKKLNKEYVMFIICELKSVSEKIKILRKNVSYFDEQLVVDIPEEDFELYWFQLLHQTLKTFLIGVVLHIRPSKLVDLRGKFFALGK
jgi:hypothetical protein